MISESLIERVESDDRADRQLDLDIAIAVWGRPGVLVGRQDEPEGPVREHTYWKYTEKLDDALSLLPPGFWWRGGTCCVSSEAIVCPDHNDKYHGPRLHRECPPEIEHWNSGIEVELRPGNPFALCRALIAACLRARMLMQQPS